MINIHAISFDPELVKGWFKADDSARGIGYMDHPQTPANIIMTDFNPFPFKIPCRLDDVDAIRQSYKEFLNAEQCSIVEADLIEAAGLPIIRVIEKQQQQPAGMAYKGSLTIPLTNAFFILRAWCFEGQPTGMRESVLMTQFMAGGTFDPGKEDWGGWMIDPYKLGKQPVMRNVAEDEKYDEQFPGHPLTRCRHFLKRIVTTLRYDPGKSV